MHKQEKIAFFFFSSRRRHTRSLRDWSSDVCSSDLTAAPEKPADRPDVPKSMTADELANRRLIVILFDTSSMQPEEIDRAVKAAGEYLEKQVAPARSEERRVGKEGRSGWSEDPRKKK